MCDITLLYLSIRGVIIHYLYTYILHTGDDTSYFSTRGVMIQFIFSARGVIIHCTLQRDVR